MDGPSDFLRLLQYEQAWSTANRQLRLRRAEGSLSEVLDVLLPQRIVGSETICGGIEYRIACLAGTPSLPLKDLIALPIEIQILTDRGQLRSVCGIVTEARAGDSDGGLAVYHLAVRDALAVMEKRTNSRIFRYQNEIEIVRTLCDERRHSNAVLASAFELELDPLFDMAQFPPREQTMQYNESDAAFVRRLLKRRGIAWCVRPGRSRTSAVDRVRDRTPAHTLVLFKDATSLRQNVAGTVRYHRDDAVAERDVITSWTGKRELQPGRVTRHSWDYKNPHGAPFMTASAPSGADQGSYGNALAASLDDYLVEIPHAGNDIEDLQRLGQLRMNRHDFESKCFHGEGNVRDFCAGEYFTLEGHPEVDAHPPSERDFVITEISVEARNNLPEDVATRADRLLAGGRPAAGDIDRPGLVQVRFTVVRRSVPIVPAFDPRVDLPHPQLQSAVVVGPVGEDVHCDALGRVKIRFPGMRAEDHEHAHGAGASNGPGDSAWVRVSSSWAGNGPSAQQQAGTLTLPRVGSEVLVSFLGGDPDRPVIVGQLFNQVAAPPAFNGVGGLPGNRYQSGTRTHEIHGQRGNQLRFDDTPDQISAQLASDHGASELNLGWLTQPRSNGQASPRGEGAELRSDHAVAIRGGKGVLLTAEASRAAEGAQLGRAGLVGLADLLQGVVDEVGRLAEHHAGDESTGRLADLADKLRHWHDGSNVASGAGEGGAPIVAVTAPAGIVLASPDSLALGSEKKVTMASADDAEVSAGRNIFVRAARGLSMFAHALGIKIVAGRGNVSVQAHQGNVEIKASGRISLIAAEGIDLQAPEVRVVAQGAQSDWGHDNVTHQCVGKHVVKAAQSVRVGPGGGTPASLNLPSSKMRTDERVVLRHLQSGEPLPNQRYSVQLDDGRTIDGTTDADGRSSLLVSDLIRVSKVSFFKDAPGAS
ncbi:type VI secretion system Vgr family protein [Massilia sp.]|uniref:type VI secretion system Vgr family protein n=1 Tax=Massilia sp. TaxID=1882437 RepID=UPI00352F6A6C